MFRLLGIPLVPNSLRNTDLHSAQLLGHANLAAESGGVGQAVGQVLKREHGINMVNACSTTSVLSFLEAAGFKPASAIECRTTTSDH